MADIIDLSGQRVSSVASKTPQTASIDPPARQVKTYRIREKMQDATVEVTGVMYITPLFVAVGEEGSADFLYLCPFDNLANFVALEAVVETDGLPGA